jgi:hypothetical protein
MRNTNWTTATTDPYQAIVGVLSAAKYKRNAWIEIQKNGKQDLPLTITNPALDDPFNWTMSYGVPDRNKDERFLNDTEKDLVENWTAAFGDPKRIEAYRKNRKLHKDLSKGIGTCFPLRKEDMLKLRPDLPPGFNLWTTYWKPKDGIPCRIPDPGIDKVYVVVTDNEEVDEQKMLSALKKFVLSIEKIL